MHTHPYPALVACLWALCLPFLLIGQTLEVSFSHPPGFYTDPVGLSMATDHPGASIHYTIDGAVPGTGATPYGGPVWLSSLEGVPNGVSMIPTNHIELGHPYREEWLPPQGEVFKVHVIRARALLPNGTAGPVATATYVVDAEGAARYSLPVVSLVAEQDSLFGDARGIYVPGQSGDNFYQRGRDWERPAHISLFEADGTLAFAQDAGVRIHGGTSRNRPRKSLRLYARSEYGASWFQYPLFPDKPVARYKTFLLRNSGNDWSESLFRDAYMQALIKGNTILDLQYARAAIVFVNGEYWGIHNIRDRYDDRYLQAHYNLDPERIAILEGQGLLDDGHQDGVQAYASMYAFVTGQDMANEAHFEAASLLMDMDNYIEYQCLNIFCRNTDWPGNNVAYWRYLDGTPTPGVSHPADGRWRWLPFDMDFGFGLDFDYVASSGAAHGQNNAFHQTLAFALSPNGMPWPNPAWSTALFRSLMMNPGFRQRFLSRYADHLNTSFNSTRALALLDSLEQIYRPEMEEHIARWTQPTTERWEAQLNTMRTFATLRADVQRSQANNYYSLGGTVPVVVDVDDSAAGHVKVNTVGVRNGTPGVFAPVYPWEGRYFRHIPVTLTAVPAPGFAFSHWSGDLSGDSATVVWHLTAQNAVTAHFVPAEYLDPMNPPPHRIADADYFFGAWWPTEPEGSFPPHIVFQQSNVDDPGLDTEMTVPYFIPYIDANNNEYHADDQDKIGFPYSLTGRTRIEALGEDGIAFINTGRARDLGTAVLALDTRDAANVRIEWTAQTLVANSRVYHIRLQYRMGLDGSWLDVLDADGQLVEYQRTPAPGEAATMTDIPLPQEAYDQPYVQLRWKYYYTGIRLTQDSGARDKLRLDDIRVWQQPTSTAATPPRPTAQLLPNHPNPFGHGTTLHFILPHAVPVRLEVYDLMGRHLATVLDGPLPAGEHRIPYTHAGRSGALLYRLTTPDGVLTGKMVATE